MKKTLLVSALALAVAAGASAKTADELRVYINPGHGSWTPNDRPCTLVGHGAYSRTNTDTLSFFESNTNLRKGFGVLERLRSYGLKYDATLNQEGDRWQTGAARDLSNNIVMSHVKCGPYHEDNGTENQLGEATPADIYYYNRNLSEICAEVDANNFDMFISIHSNANVDGDQVNYPLGLYRGYDTPTEQEGVTLEHQQASRAMADAAWDYVYANKMNQWSAYASSKNLRGDCNFYGSASLSRGYYGYLGVLKHGTPGYLYEGYFHTYQPARHRYMNWDVCYVEGDAYAHGAADYFGLDKADKNMGCLMGQVRDKNEKFKDNAYKPMPTTDDAYLPVNGAKVVLKKDGVQVAEYTTDNYYNGVFVFRDLEAGKYTLEVSAEGYIASEPMEVEVKAMTLTQPTVQIVNETWTPPTVVYVNYPDPVDVGGIYAADEYTFNQSFVDEPVAQLEGKTVRRVLAKNGKLYILARNEAKEPTIVVYDTEAKAVAAEVSTEGAQGSVAAVGDIQLTADGVLLACNESLNQFSDAQIEDGETRGYLRVYRWENDENGLPAGAPVEMFSSTLSGNLYRATVGHTMCYSGTLADGKLMTPAVTVYDSGNMFFNQYTVLDGELAASGYNNSGSIDRTVFNSLVLGEDFSFMTDPDSDDYFIVTSGKIAPTRADWATASTTTALAAGAADNAIGSQLFRYAGHNYMAYADNEGDANNGVKLADLKGMTDGQLVSTVNTALEAASTNALAAGEGVAVKNAEEVTTSVHINLYAVRDAKVSKLTTQGVDVKAEANPMAYGLKGQPVDENNYTVTYSLTTAAKAATLVLTPAEGEAVEMPLSDLEAGEHTYNVDLTALDENVEYTWAVKVEGKTVPVSGLVKEDNSGLTVRGGVVVITDPEQDSFGYVIVGHGRNQGYDIYDPAGQKVGDRVWKNHKTMQVNTTNQSNPIRGAQIRGKAAFGGWGDAAEGVVYIDPLNLEQEPQPMIAGTMVSSGAHMLDGVNLGGGTSCVEFTGKGADTKMYTFSEDHAGTSNTIVCYDLGEAWQATTAPTQIGYAGRLANTNVDLQNVADKFLVASQVRSAGGNATGTPGFIILSLPDHSEVFNSASLSPAAEVPNGEMNSCNSGVAVSVDGKTLVVHETARMLVYDADFTGAEPVLTFRYAISTPSVDWSHMRFDNAGNLHVFTRSGNGYKVYALAQENPVATTPAKAEYVMKGAASGVEDIAIDQPEANDAPAVYYNLNGVQLDGNNLTPGVYVKVQGGKATKVVVK